MTAVAAGYGARGKSMRAAALVLAALATGIPMFLLILGLSIQTLRAIQDSRMTVDLIPLPQTPPPEPPKPSPAKPAEHAAAPAAAAPRPATLLDLSAPILPQPTPQPATADVSGAGTGTTPGPGTNGNGPGGDGAGPVGGTVKPTLRVGASWIFKPGTQELLPYNPPRARIDYVTGNVMLNCRVLASQRVADCRVTAERPRGYGFGKAAMAVTPMFRLNPPTIDGQPDEQRRVEIPVTFNNKR